MYKKGFIFDFDGVIVDIVKYYYFVWKKLVESIGIIFLEKDNE